MFAKSGLAQKKMKNEDLYKSAKENILAKRYKPIYSRNHRKGTKTLHHSTH